MSRIIREITEEAEELHSLGFMSDKKLETIKSISIPKLNPYTADEVKALRKKLHLTQNILAKCIHVSPSLVKKWEQGARHPSGSNLLALHLIAKCGIKPLLSL
jgi:putative transcriptional regulator